MHTFRRARKHRTIALFLLAFFFYDMGVTTIMGMSSVFAILLAGKQPLWLFRTSLVLGALSQLDRIIISSLLPNNWLIFSESCV